MGLCAIGAATVCILYFLVPVILRATIKKPAMYRGKRRLVGKVALVTGANAGLGKITTADLAQRGAHVYMACRNMTKAAATKQMIEAQVPGAKLTLIELNLNSLAAVRQTAEEFRKQETRLDILMNNAGFASQTYQTTEDGIELHLGVNHLGHFVLTRLLLPLLKKSGSSHEKSRIVNVASYAHTMCAGIDYEGLEKGSFVAVQTAYGMSKLANIYFTKYLAKLLSDSNVTVTALHPGVVKTEFYRNYFNVIWPFNYIRDILGFPFSYMALSDVEGAQTQIYAAVAEELEGMSGTYFSGCKVATPNARAKDEKEWEKLWRWSCEKSGMSLKL